MSNPQHNGGGQYGTSMPGQLIEVQAEEQIVTIPDHFTRCMCCACTCQNLSFSECCGCKWSGTTCCLEGSAVCCKYIDHPTACCLCWSGTYECVKPKQFCKMYEQCMCCECFCSVPSLSEGYRKTPIAQTAVQDEFLPKAQSNPIIFCALCCIVDSCYWDFPSCVGMYEKGVILCLESELVACKPMCYNHTKANEDSMCVCLKGHMSLVKPYTCVKLIGQFFCVDQRCALPYDDEVPCLITYLPFCTCSCIKGGFNVLCCQTIGQVTGKHAANPNTNPPQYNNSPLPAEATISPAEVTVNVTVGTNSKGNASAPPYAQAQVVNGQAVGAKYEL